MSPKPLEGRTALVTGAARGLGRAYALRLATMGASVVVSDVNLRAYEEFEREAASAGDRTTGDQIRSEGGAALEIEADVSRRAEVDAMVAAAHERFGSIDIVVCNAGGGAGGLGGGKPSELDEAETRLILDRNLHGTINTCVAVAPHMKRQQRGKIITVSSVAGIQPVANGAYAHYGVAKAAVIMYTRYLAQDLGRHGVTVNCVAPGQITTGRLMVGFEKIGIEKLEANNPMRRLGTVEDCAGVVAFLASTASDYMNGVTMTIDGGLARV